MKHKQNGLLLILLFLFFTPCFPKSFINFFTAKKPPKIVCNGIQNNKYYSGKLNCQFDIQGEYSLDKIKVALDDLPIAVKKKHITKKPFAIDTTKLSDGLHTLSIDVRDGSLNKNKSSKKITFYVDNLPLKPYVFNEKLLIKQGQTVYLKIMLNKKIVSIDVNFLGTDYHCVCTKKNPLLYECFIPLDLEQKTGKYDINMVFNTISQRAIKAIKKVTVIKNYYKKSQGFTVSKAKLRREKKISARGILREQILEKAVAESRAKKLWDGPFCYPMKIKKITSPFGEVRNREGGGYRYHKGVDLVDTPRCPLYAAQDGNVILKGRYNGTGNTVVIDHGLGVFSLYYHLEKFSNIQVGDFVKRGKVLGKVGMTGYATGYHLHWEIRINNNAVDPFQWTRRDFWS